MMLRALHVALAIVFPPAALALDSIEVSFLDGDGKNLSVGKFYLFRNVDGEFAEAIYRDHPVTKGHVVLKRLPKEGSIGFISADGYHTTLRKFKDLKTLIRNNEIHIKIQKTGKIRASLSDDKFATTGPSKMGPFVVPYFQHQTGSIERIGGIGVFLGPSSDSEIGGLRTGIYHFEIRDRYKSERPSTVFYKSKKVSVAEGKTTELKGIKLEPLARYRLRE